MQRYSLNFYVYKKTTKSYHVFFFQKNNNQNIIFIFLRDLVVYVPYKTHFLFFIEILELFEILMKNRYFNTRSASYSISLHPGY
jgi:hypothetical protein